MGPLAKPPIKTNASILCFSTDDSWRLMGKAHAYETLRTLAVLTPTAAGVDGGVEGWTGTLPVVSISSSLLSSVAAQHVSLPVEGKMLSPRLVSSQELSAVHEDRQGMEVTGQLLHWNALGCAVVTCNSHRSHRGINVTCRIFAQIGLE